MVAFCWAVEVQRCSLSSGPWRLRSSGAHCDLELAKRMGGALGEEDWQGGTGGGREGGE